MANDFVDVLNTVSLQLGTREAGNNREFIERRLDSSRADLRRAEDALRAYQEKSKMIVIPEQNSSASVGGVAELYGMKAKKEIELAILQKSLESRGPLDRAAPAGTRRAGQEARVVSGDRDRIDPALS